MAMSTVAKLGGIPQLSLQPIKGSIRASSLKCIGLTSYTGLSRQCRVSRGQRQSVVALAGRSGPITAQLGEELAITVVQNLPQGLQSVAERAQHLMYTIAADPVVEGGTEVLEAVKNDDGWLSGLTGLLESTLKVLESGLAAVHIPYAFGFSIILLTILVKLLTYPLTKKQVESTLAMQNLQPKVKAIQERYKGDQERTQLETSRLYKQAGVNPLAGCLPTLATLPVWIGLYKALSNVANEGLLTEGFFFIPSLAGPTTVAARTSGNGLSWLFPFVDGQPPLGWNDTIAYLVLPVVLVISQYVSMQIMTPQTSKDDPAQQQSQAILKFLPLMIGWFSLSVPAGLSLYWLTNNVLSTAQQVFLRKMGGAEAATGIEGGVEILTAGTAKRTGAPVAPKGDEKPGPAPGERFRRLKEEEEAKKAARREAALKAQAEKEGQAAVTAQQQDNSSEDGAESDHEGTDDEQGDDTEVPSVAPAKAGSSTNGSASGTQRKTRRSKRKRTTA